MELLFAIFPIFNIFMTRLWFFATKGQLHFCELHDKIMIIFYIVQWGGDSNFQIIDIHTYKKQSLSKFCIKGG